jgi:hypothetical protein
MECVNRMKKKKLVWVFGAALMLLTLGGCGSEPAPVSASPLPVAAAGSVVTTFTGKVTDKKGTTLKIDMDNATLQSSVVGDASPSPEVSAHPAAGSSSGITKGLTVDVPLNVAVTQQNGKAGTLKDIKVGGTVTFTMTDSVVTSMTVVKTK